MSNRSYPSCLSISNFNNNITHHFLRNGNEYWYKEGKYHRDFGPAILLRHGYSRVITEIYYKEGKLHREGAPAIIFTSQDREEWYLNGVLHREKHPAYICDGVKKWFINGQLHREDGPAIECKDGTKAWYLKNKLVKIHDPKNLLYGAKFSLDI